MAETSTGRARCTEETTMIADLVAERTGLLHLLWECHCAASDGVPVPFNAWLLDGGPADMPQDVKELREAYDTVSEHEHKCIGVRDHYRVGLEHIAKTWANGNGAGPDAKRVLETAPAQTSDDRNRQEAELGLGMRRRKDVPRLPLIEENGRLRKALRFYSDGFAYLTPQGWKRIWRDGGQTARTALASDENQDGETT